MKSFAIAGFSLLLAGCATLTARGTDPAFTVVAKRPLNQTVSCIISGLNREMQPKSPLEPQITHQASITEPDRVMEISPQQTLTVGAEVYFVRVSAILPAETKIELFARALWSDRLIPPLKACA